MAKRLAQTAWVEIRTTRWGVCAEKAGAGKRLQALRRGMSDATYMGLTSELPVEEAAPTWRNCTGHRRSTRWRSRRTPQTDRARARRGDAQAHLQHARRYSTQDRGTGPGERASSHIAPLPKDGAPKTLQFVGELIHGFLLLGRIGRAKRAIERIRAERLAHLRSLRAQRGRLLGGDFREAAYG